jgi:hypothetical protein
MARKQQLVKVSTSSEIIEATAAPLVPVSDLSDAIHEVSTVVNEMSTMPEKDIEMAEAQEAGLPWEYTETGVVIPTEPIFTCPNCLQTEPNCRVSQESIYRWTLEDFTKHCGALSYSADFAKCGAPPNSPELGLHSKPKVMWVPIPADPTSPFKVRRYRELKSCLKPEAAGPKRVDEAVSLRKTGFAKAWDVYQPSDTLLYNVTLPSNKAFHITGHYGAAKQRLASRISSTLEKDVVKRVITRRIISLEKAVGEDEILARRLCAANTVANRPRGQKRKASEYNSPILQLPLDQRTAHFEGLKKFEKRERKLRFAEKVQVKEFEYDVMFERLKEEAEKKTREVAEKQKEAKVQKAKASSAGFVRYSIDEDDDELRKVEEPTAAESKEATQTGPCGININEHEEAFHDFQRQHADYDPTKSDRETARKRYLLFAQFELDLLDQDVTKEAKGERWKAQFGQAKEMPVKVRSRHCHVHRSPARRKLCRCTVSKIQDQESMAKAAKAVAESMFGRS